MKDIISRMLLNKAVKLECIIIRFISVGLVSD
uniref:Uncharacterized protein n=1 Tax=Myoviridae sp. ctCo31 TaxID=2825053 RepID=A0A8S5UM98_9CAUD|nr:MAG TPA: hypothetical protein [Myoviridae sp. ctCo31]